MPRSKLFYRDLLTLVLKDKVQIISIGRGQAGVSASRFWIRDRLANNPGGSTVPNVKVSWPLASPSRAGEPASRTCPKRIVK
jgi:hypothetical protein